MYVPNRLFVRPVAWSLMNPSAEAVRANPNIFSSIQIFGYTSDGRTIYVSIPRKSTFIIKFGQEIDEDMVENINEIMNPTSVKPSYMDPTIVIVRAPAVSPIELTDNPDYEGLAVWNDIKQDPYGEIESLWETKEIGPYEWLSISKYAPIPGKYTNCDLNIKADEDNISSAGHVDLPDIFPRLFFWDIETFSNKKGEFSNSTNPDDFIAVASIITVSENGTNGFVIIKGDINQDLINQSTENMVVLKAIDEKDLISKFFAIYNTSQPDRQIYYNGDMFDMPYLLNRLSIQNVEIPRISKISSLNPWVVNRSYPTPFGRQCERTMVIPGTEIIDLIHFYRRFYPHFKNHKLDTVCKSFIGKRNHVSSTNIAMDDMIEAIHTNNVDKLAKVIDYSFADSLCMSKLWDASDVQIQLESVCNNLGISIDTLLRLSFESIIDRAVYNIDAGSSIVKGKYDSPTHLTEATKGVYRNVFIYDYSELYRQIMIRSELPIASALGSRLEGAPPKLKMLAFYSTYVDREKLLPLLNSMLKSVLGTNTIIALEPFIIRSVGPLNAEWVKELGRSPCYVSVAKASYIVLDNGGELETSGLSELCRPQFELAADIIQQYLSLVYSDNLKDFALPDMREVPINKFYMTDRLGDISTMVPNSVKYQLAVQYGSPIVTWVSVTYVMTKQGPVLLSKLKDDNVIDYEYYTAELYKYIKDLQALKIY